jgi:hypothetical protein
MQDVDGREVFVGDLVKVLSIDAGFLECLTDEEKSHHLAMVENEYCIDEIVENGSKASVTIDWEIEGGVAIGGLYMLSSEFRLIQQNSE